MSFEHATDTSHQYIGKINGKTYVVPHHKLSFYHDNYKKPIPHDVVTSREHVKEHNPGFSDEEIDQVHHHIQAIHKKLEESVTSTEDTMRQEKRKLHSLKQHMSESLEVYQKHYDSTPGTPYQKKVATEKAHNVKLTTNSSGRIVHAATLEEEQKFKVIDHTGKEHEVTGKDRDHAMQKVVDRRSEYVKGGIPLSQWNKVKVQPLTEETHAYKVHLNGKHIDTIFYGHHEDPEEVKRSLVNHDGYHPGIKVTKERKKKLEEGFKTGDGRRFVTRDEAVAHANKVNAKTGNVIAVEATKEKMKEEVEQVDEGKNFMATYRRNEAQNRHTANIVHLAKHYGSEEDQNKAKFFSDELKRHGYNAHSEESNKLHMKLWAKAKADHGMNEQVDSLEEEKFIQKAIKHPGALHKALHVPQDEKIPAKKLEAATHAKGKLGKEARLAKTLRKFHEERMLSERHLTASETEKKEEIVKSMKKEKGGFQKRYGSRAKEVMYATATKRAKEMSEGNTFDMIKGVLNEVFTRKHFRQVADIIKAHPDPEKRKELASHHSEIFAKSNPRFDKKRFYQAAGVDHA